MSASLGDRVRCRITGFAGTVTGRAEYLFAVPQVLVVPAELRDGAPAAGTWLDEERVEVTDAAEDPPRSRGRIGIVREAR